MEKISISIDAELDIMTKYGLTAEEWWIIKLLFLALYPEDRTEPLERYLKITGGLNSNIIESLQEKGILKKFKVKKQHYDLDTLQFNYLKSDDGKLHPDIPFTANFIKSYLKHSGELGKELYLAYPRFIRINGSDVDIKNITTGGHFGSLEDFFFFYGKTIKWDAETHKQILYLVEYGKENGLIKESIVNFVINQRWRGIQEAIQKGIGEYNTNTLI